MPTRPIRVGTFLETSLVSERLPRVSEEWLPRDDVARCLELLAGLENVEFRHGLNIDQTYIRNSRLFHDDVCLNELDLYVWYAQIDRGPSSYHIEALRALSLDTQVMIEPSSFAVGVDKYSSHLTLRRAGVRVADALLVHVDNVALAEPIMAEWGRAVLKPRRGFFGKGVLLIDDFPTLRDVAGYLATQVPGLVEPTLLLERFYEHDPSDWVSTTIINGSIMYGYRKRPALWSPMRHGASKVLDADAAGGEAALCEVPPAYAELALKAHKALGLEIVGFDMVLDDSGPLIIDENTYPGLYPELFCASHKDLGHELFRMIAEAIERCRTSRASGSPA